MDEEVLGKAYDGRLMRRLLGYLRPYSGAVILALLAMLAGSAFQVVGPLLTKAAVDWYLVPVAKPPAPWNSWLASDPHLGLGQLCLAYLVMIAAAFALGFAEAYLMQWTGQRAMYDLRRQLMEHLHRADLAFFDHNPVGRLVTRVTTDVDALNELLASGLVSILGDLLSLSLVLAVMLRLSRGLTLVLLSVMPLIVMVTWLFRRQAMASYRRIRTAIARINAYLQEHITGMAVVQLFNREARSMEGFRQVNRDHMLAFKEAITAYGWFYPVVEFLAILSLALVLAYGGFRVQGGDLTLGVLVAFFQYGMRFFRPIQDLSEKYNLLQAAMAASE
ncbi:MAG: ABC transporter ATP-binding protein, partial [Bryobacteraceae bacterium]